MLRTSLLFAVPLAALILADLIDRAVTRSGASHKALAIEQGISTAQWSREIHGVGHVAFDRIVTRCSDAFVAALLEEVARARGFVLEQTFSLRRSA
jgi:hypothetical protein